MTLTTVGLRPTPFTSQWSHDSRKEVKLGYSVRCNTSTQRTQSCGGSSENVPPGQHSAAPYDCWASPWPSSSSPCTPAETDSLRQKQTFIKELLKLTGLKVMNRTMKWQQRHLCHTADSVNGSAVTAEPEKMICWHRWPRNPDTNNTHTETYRFTQLVLNTKPSSFTWTKSEFQGGIFFQSTFFFVWLFFLVILVNF